jgi:hypothetical protein
MVAVAVEIAETHRFVDRTDGMELRGSQVDHRC